MTARCRSRLGRSATHPPFDLPVPRRRPTPTGRCRRTDRSLRPEPQRHPPAPRQAGRGRGGDRVHRSTFGERSTGVGVQSTRRADSGWGGAAPMNDLRWLTDSSAAGTHRSTWVAGPAADSGLRNGSDACPLDPSVEHTSGLRSGAAPRRRPRFDLTLRHCPFESAGPADPGHHPRTPPRPRPGCRRSGRTIAVDGSGRHARLSRATVTSVVAVLSDSSGRHRGGGIQYRTQDGLAMPAMSAADGLGLFSGGPTHRASTSGPRAGTSGHSARHGRLETVQVAVHADRSCVNAPVTEHGSGTSSR